MTIPFPTATQQIQQRVSFLGCTGSDNEGTLISVKPCNTWGKMAEVLWDSGETSHVRYADLNRGSIRAVLATNETTND